MTRSARPGRACLAMLILVALAVSWVAMYTMHVGTNNASTGSRMVMSAAVQPEIAAMGAQTRVTGAQQAPSLAAVHAPMQRCESLNTQSRMPQSGTAALPLLARDALSLVPPVPVCDPAAPRSALRSLPPPSLLRLSISRT